MSAINICLVKGWLRPATLVEPDKTRNRYVDFPKIENIVQEHGLMAVRWSALQLLVYQPDMHSLVTKVLEDQSDHISLGELLGYKCPGDLYVTTSIRYHIDFVVRNPDSGNENFFIGYICASLTQDLLDDLIQEGRDFSRFLRGNGISPQVKLKIWHYIGFDGTEKKSIDDFNQWL